MKRKRERKLPTPQVDNATLTPILAAGPGRDLFAEIAAQRCGDFAERNLVESAPVRVENILPGKHNKAAAFRPAPKIDTPARLERELARLRKRFAPFLKDYAPERENPRWHIRLDAFDWRLETEEDRRDFAATLAGEGAWETVRIPHYGGPLGRATAYYRTVFHVPTDMLDDHFFVAFKGVDYKAQVFVNGYPVGAHEGFFAPFDCDATKAVRPGGNVLLVKVDNDAICLGNDSWDDDHDGDKLYAATGCGYDDPAVGWHHCPPGMGIYQHVHIERRARLHVHDLFVRPILEEQRAEAWLEIHNATPERHPVVVEYAVFGRNFRKTVVARRRYDPPGPMGPTLNYLRIPFDVPKPRIWDSDTPWLYELEVRLLDADGRVLDTARRSFGMRSFAMDEGCEPKGRFRLNGREIRMRGANEMGFVQQCVLREDWDALRDAILLAKIANMNFLRFTQRPVQSEIYDWCDRLGLMTQTDLPLFGCLRRNQFCEAIRQAEEMERLVRAHPCNVLDSYINEPAPTFGGGGYRHLTRPELEGFFDAADRAVRLANPDRVVKPVDGDYDPPGPGLPDNHCYCGWYNGHGLDLGRLRRGYWQRVKPGWFYGCGEFGSEGIDRVALMLERYPADWLPHGDTDWSPSRIVKAQTGRFHYMWFDAQTTLDDWVCASQAHQAWITRLMTEAFRRDARMNSCAIHLFIDAFPAGWMKAIMDCTMTPKPAYFAYREALAPLAANLRTDRRHWWSGESIEIEAWICNDRNDTPKAMLHWQVEHEGAVVFAQRCPARVPVCGSAAQGLIRFEAPVVDRRTSLEVRLGLLDTNGRVLHDTSIDIEVFPRQRKSHAEIAVIGPHDGLARRLLRELGLKHVFKDALPCDSCLLVDPEIAVDKQRMRELDYAAALGAHVYFLDLPVGTYRLVGDDIRIEPCGMGARHFVSRNTGHPAVRDFQPDDFRFWFDEDAGYVTPLLKSLFPAPAEWTPILTTGQGGWGNEEWRPALAVAEKRHGKGSVCVCQLALAGRVRTNPVACQFARRLLGL